MRRFWFPALPALTLVACAERSACASSVLAVQPSPDLSRKAVIYARSCDRRQMTMNVSIVPAGIESGVDPGNALVYVVGPGVMAIGVPRTRWQAPDRLMIHYDPAQERLFSTEEVGGVRVLFDSLGTPDS